MKERVGMGVRKRERIESEGEGRIGSEGNV